MSKKSKKAKKTVKNQKANNNVKVTEVKEMKVETKKLNAEVKNADAKAKKAVTEVKDNFIEVHNKALAYSQQLNEMGTEVGLLWVQFGELLFQIKRGKEYKKPHPEFKQQNGYKSFADYVGTEFSICRQYAYTLIYGYVKYQTLRDKKLINAGEKLSEGLLRALPNKKDQMILIWKAARKKAGTAPVTPKLVMDCREAESKTKSAASKKVRTFDADKAVKSMLKKYGNLSMEEVERFVEALKAQCTSNTTAMEKPAESEQKTA